MVLRLGPRPRPRRGSRGAERPVVRVALRSRSAARDHTAAPDTLIDRRIVDQTRSPPNVAGDLRMGRGPGCAAACGRHVGPDPSCSLGRGPIGACAHGGIIPNAEAFRVEPSAECARPGWSLVPRLNATVVEFRFTGRPAASAEGGKLPSGGAQGIRRDRRQAARRSRVCTIIRAASAASRPFVTKCAR